MNRNLLWKVVLILAVLVVFTVAIIPTKNNPEPIKRGLDLKGGSHLVMQVNVGDAYRVETDQAMEALKTQSATLKLPTPATRRTADDTFVMAPPQGLQTGEYERIAKDFLPQFGVTKSERNELVLQLSAAAKATIQSDTVSHAVETIRNRVDALGVTEPVITPATNNRIVLQLPGVDDPARVKDIIKTTAQLQFRIVEGSQADTPEAALNTVPANMRAEVDILPSNKEDNFGRVIGSEYLPVRKSVPVTGVDLKTARVQKGRMNEPVIGFSLTADGGRKFGELTGANVGRRLAIVLDNKIQSAPTIESRIDGEGQITGRFTPQQAADLSLILRSGSLPASLTTLEERTVGPSLGRDSIRKGLLACAVGFVLLILAVVAYYRGAGINAVIALILNLIILLGMMAYFDAKLTLPGIAGIILTLAMAVDSNVLVFERIREELREGKTARASIEQGFSRAFGTIIDTHMTTIISALFLLQFGTGPIRGFAVTLLIGLAASVFTAFFVSRVIFDMIYKPTERPSEISI